MINSKVFTVKHGISTKLFKHGDGPLHPLQAAVRFACAKVDRSEAFAATVEDNYGHVLCTVTTEERRAVAAKADAERRATA